MLRILLPLPYPSLAKLLRDGYQLNNSVPPPSTLGLVRLAQEILPKALRGKFAQAYPRLFLLLTRCYPLIKTGNLELSFYSSIHLRNRLLLKPLLKYSATN